MTTLIDEIRAETEKSRELFPPEGRITENNVHNVHHVHQYHGENQEELNPEEISKFVSKLESYIQMGKENPGLYASAEFLTAAKAVYRNDPENWVRIRVAIKAEKPSGVLLSDIDEAVRAGQSVAQESTADELVRLAQGSGELFYDDTTRDGFITVAGETMKVRSLKFSDWLSYAYYRQSNGSSASDASLKQACGTLSGLCKFEGKSERVYLRAGKHRDTGAYYLHGVGDAGRVVEIPATGWRIIDKAPVRFWQAGSAMPYPEPVPGGDINRLWELVNIPEKERPLVLAWLLEACRPDTPFAVLELSGIQGSAKSSTQKRLRTLIDPSSAPLRSIPKTVEDGFVSAGNNWIMSLDNLSHLSAPMQDAFCIMATDGAFAGRTLHTNADETVIQIKRPVLISGINSVVTAQDLTSRTVHVELPVIGTRLLESELDTAFEAAWPEIFGGLLDLFVQTLAKLPTAKPPCELHRMADFNLLGEAMMQAQGDKPGAFTALYGENIQESVSRAIESSPVAVAVLQMTEESPYQVVFEGTYKELLDRLLKYKADGEGWPKSEKGLAGSLKRQIPALQSVGVIVIPERGMKQSKKGRTVTIKKSGEHGERCEHHFGQIGSGEEKVTSEAFISQDREPF